MQACMQILDLKKKFQLFIIEFNSKFMNKQRVDSKTFSSKHLVSYFAREPWNGLHENAHVNSMIDS